MSIFCKHEWVVVVDKIVPSLLERLVNNKVYELEMKYVQPGKSITILACSKCGKVNKTIEDI